MIAIVLLSGSALTIATAHAAAPPDAPRVFLWDPAAAAKLRAQALAGDERIADAIASIREAADKALAAGPFSVTHKTFLPPSGDPHDFSTLGRYWWPNPDTPDGLPWVRRDGETNPEYFNGALGDTQRFLDMTQAVSALARAYHVTDHGAYAEHAAKLIRVWFIEPDMRMNPHARYAARFPGHWDGAGWGIHGTRQLMDVADAIGLIQRSPAWSSADQDAMRDWFSQYLAWLLESDLGQEEGSTVNNHATAYDCLVVTLALFTGDDATAKRFVEKAKAERIAAQIEPDGRQPHELARANPWRYSGYSLEFHFRLALLADRVGVDLWHYQSDDGRSIRKALDFLVQSIEQGQPAGSIDNDVMKEIGVARLGPLLQIAADVYGDDRYRGVMQRIGWNGELRIHWSGPNPLLARAE